MTNLKQLVASNIKTYRNTLGLSQSKLADKVDTATNYIASIEAGRRFPSAEMLERIAIALCIDSPELFSMKPLQNETIEKLHKDILLNIEKTISNQLAEFELNCSAC
jgi:transcriptional regulator with XRE-family HTH domain